MNYPLLKHKHVHSEVKRLIRPYWDQAQWEHSTALSGNFKNVKFLNICDDMAEKSKRLLEEEILELTSRKPK